MEQKVSLKKFNNFRELQNATMQAWTTEITKNLCEKLVSSMPSRIKSVLKSNGGHCEDKILYIIKHVFSCLLFSCYSWSL